MFVRLEIPQRKLIKSRPYLIVINLVVCSFVTPDFVATFFMVLPLQVLFEICILMGTHKSAN